MYSVGICIDEGYFLPALATLTSLADSRGPAEVRSIGVRVLTTDLARSRAATMAAVVHRLGFGSFDLRWQRTDAHWRLASCGHISAATYLRFGFTRRFVDRPHFVYLDADLLVLGDLSGPFDSLATGQVALVRDRLVHAVGRGQALPGVVQRWPSFAGRPYYNAGVMWCASETLPGLRGHIATIMARAQQHIHFNDQDALNLWALFSGAVVPAGAAWNTFELERFEEGAHLSDNSGSADPVVLHFVGPDKPWQRTCPPCRGVRLYRSYLTAARRLTSQVGDRIADLPPLGG
ncbi:glycosyltransferase [Plantactinospora sp. B5E13]|uniref:glycosyltransferase family 8 protein n=1 Tax=unclassified Plantactinospora TaxID=2631981 RepID=UPI00325F7014